MGIKFKRKKFLYLIIILTIFLLFCCKKSQKENIFSTIEIDKENKTIIFSAKLNLSKEKKYFLFYFESYPWLKPHCVFTSSSKLKELQTSIASIDWNLWDKIYTQKFLPKLKIEIFYNNQWEDLKNFLLIKNFDVYQTIFWGSQTYDDTVIYNNYKSFPCATCKIFPLEKDVVLKDKKILNYRFIKKIPDGENKFRMRF